MVSSDQNKPGHNLPSVEPAGRATWSPLECLYALRHAADATEGSLGRPTYNEWRAAQDGLYPSRYAIEAHWPSFTAARAIALGNREEIPPDAWEA